ncbi:MAG TPA: shikimate kinase, partial [candidate division Zixibacteria bacterium]|nr:shikimate kinase [candidate division Zixibacteria bacterium]
AGVREVVVLGGGAFTIAVNRDLVRRAGVAVYIQCSVRELARRMRRHADRPLLTVVPNPGESLPEATRRRVAELLEERREFYLLADMTVSSTARLPVSVVEEIVRKLENRYEPS